MAIFLTSSKERNCSGISCYLLGSIVPKKSSRNESKRSIKVKVHFSVKVDLWWVSSSTFIRTTPKCFIDRKKDNRNIKEEERLTKRKEQNKNISIADEKARFYHQICLRKENRGKGNKSKVDSLSISSTTLLLFGASRVKGSLFLS